MAFWSDLGVSPDERSEGSFSSAEQTLRWSSSSKIEKERPRKRGPFSSGRWRRRMRTQMEWKVPIQGIRTGRPR